MSREEILGRIRAATANSPASVPPSPSPPPSLVSHGPDAVARFCSAAISKGVTIVEAATPQSLPAAVAEALTTARLAHSCIRLNDPAYASLPWSGAGITIARGAATPDDTVTLCRALAAVAETGTLMLASSAGNPTTLAFLSEAHVVILDRATIVGTFEDSSALLRQAYGSAFPRAVNFISGASRTGDIGGRIVHGAHGPRHLFVVLV